MKYNKCKQQQQQNSKERQPSWCITEVHRVVAAPEGKKTKILRYKDISIFIFVFMAMACV